MSSGLLIGLCLGAVAVSIILSYIYKLNTGIIAMGFAYLIGCFVMKMSVGEFISLFPVKIFFLLFSVCLFYGYPIQNGTMRILANNIIFRFRRQTRLLPFVLYFLAFFLGALGTSAPAISSLMAPVCIIIAHQTGIHYFVMLVLIAYGASAGTLVPWGQAGLIIRGIAEETEFASMANGLPFLVCVNMLVTGLVAVTAVYIVFKGYKAQHCEIEKPESLNPVQRKTLALLLVILSLVVIPSIINTLFPTPLGTKLVKLLDIQTLSILGAAICAMMKLGHEREVIVSVVPWNTIVLVMGVCMLMGVTGKTGLFDSIGNMANSTLSQTMIGCILVLICGFMSFFSGAQSVVMPLMVPIALQICSAGGFSPAALVSASCIGAVLTCISPFSTAGSLILSCVPNEKEARDLFDRQFLLTCLLFVIPEVLMAIGVYNIL